MSEPVQFKYKPEGRDYTQAMYAFYLADKRTWFAIILLLLIIVCAPVTLFLISNYYNATFLWVIPVFLLLLVFYVYIISPILAGRRVGRNPKFQSETVGEATPEYLAIKNANVDSKTKWDAYANAVETRQYFLLIHAVNRRMFQFIPKRAFANDEQLDAFRDLLNLYVKK